VQLPQNKKLDSGPSIGNTQPWVFSSTGKWKWQNKIKMSDKSATIGIEEDPTLILVQLQKYRIAVQIPAIYLYSFVTLMNSAKGNLYRSWNNKIGIFLYVKFSCMHWKILSNSSKNQEDSLPIQVP